VLGLLVRPEPFHQLGGAAAPAQVAGEQREEATQPGPVISWSRYAIRDSRVNSMVT
jgi:hypothetical protein